jgi:hypothetical protein
MHGCTPVSPSGRGTNLREVQGCQPLHEPANQADDCRRIKEIRQTQADKQQMITYRQSVRWVAVHDVAANSEWHVLGIQQLHVQPPPLYSTTAGTSDPDSVTTQPRVTTQPLTSPEGNASQGTTLVGASCQQHCMRCLAKLQRGRLILCMF